MAGIIANIPNAPFSFPKANIFSGMFSKQLTTNKLRICRQYTSENKSNKSFLYGIHGDIYIYIYIYENNTKTMDRVNTVLNGMYNDILVS